MPAQANANVVALQLEKVRDKVPLLYERDARRMTSRRFRRFSSASRLKSRSWWNMRRPGASAPSKTPPSAKSPTA